MYYENYINSLRTELVQLVSDHLTPVAIRYGYSDVPLESNIKWRPQVLLIGNYSSGKSTLINEFLGAEIQTTGQAPTDDSFTIITYEESESEDDEIRVIEQRDGKVLLNDPQYPFESLKKHGQRFASHFRLKKVNSPFLKNLAIIDTPGMLDSITERDRGYNYQEVIGDLAQIVDLVLVLFDPHKAGTVREAHKSLRETLPAKTFEDRVLYVLNRIDECASLIDLIRVYGTLCWNLSQITGRKDIPMIHLTYSQRAKANANQDEQIDSGYLRLLDNQREELKNAILQAPRYRLDHLAAFVETHGERLAQFLEALMNYRKKLLIFKSKFLFSGVFTSALIGVSSVLGLMASGVAAGLDQMLLFGAGGVIAAAFIGIWMTTINKYFTAKFHRKAIDQIDTMATLNNQTRKDSWEAIKEIVIEFLKKSGGRYSLFEVQQEYYDVCRVRDEGSKEIREALNELASIRDDRQDQVDSILSKGFLKPKEEELDLDDLMSMYRI